jgi:hypothetical protein
MDGLERLDIQADVGADVDRLVTQPSVRSTVAMKTNFGLKRSPHPSKYSDV